MKYETIIDPAGQECALIDAGLREYNLEHLGPAIVSNNHQVAVMVRAENGDLIGGVHGEIFWDWLYVKTLWVSTEYRGRGIGRHLLSEIEETALQRGFRGSHLETTSFQALDFYQKLGYEIFGELEGKPAGTTWYFLKKVLG
jgi:ribosomal protein S18 acetylase RimI-like enzyme